jgi:hypothetical protein
LQIIYKNFLEKYDLFILLQDYGKNLRRVETNISFYKYIGYASKGVIFNEVLLNLGGYLKNEIC